MGYRFTANSNGTVEELGGRWADGVAHTVRLYAFPSGTVLASTSVTGAGANWAYNAISPVSLTAGNQYVVAVRLTSNNSGVYGTVPGGMPFTSNFITVNSSMFRASSDAIPNSNSTTTMYGWADMKFVPCVRSGEVFAADSVACVNDTILLELKYSIGTIQWQSSTDGTNFTNILGAIDSVYSINAIQNTGHYRAILSSGCGSDTSNVKMITVSGSGQVGLWTGEVDDDWFNTCNWADGSVPVNGDSAIFVPGTNMPSNMPTINLRYLSLNNSQGLSLTNRLRVNDSLNLANGNIILNNNNLVLGPNANIGSNFSASYIVTNGNGTVRLLYSAAGGGERLVPLGDANAYTPCSIDLTAASSFAAGAYIALRSVSGLDPNANSPLNYLARRWETSVVNITGAVYNGRFTYDDGEVIGAESALRLQLFSGGTWTQF